LGEVGFVVFWMGDFVCLRGLVGLPLERKVSEIFDCELERATAGAMTVSTKEKARGRISLQAK
jgi:hypothetical protein